MPESAGLLCRLIDRPWASTVDSGASITVVEAPLTGFVSGKITAPTPGQASAWMCASISGLVPATRSTTWVWLPMAVNVAVPVPEPSSRPGPIVTEIVCWAIAEDDDAISNSNDTTGTNTANLRISKRPFEERRYAIAYDSSPSRGLQ